MIAVGNVWRGLSWVVFSGIISPLWNRILSSRNQTISFPFKLSWKLCCDVCRSSVCWAHRTDGVIASIICGAVVEPMMSYWPHHAMLTVQDAAKMWVLLTTTTRWDSAFISVSALYDKLLFPNLLLINLTCEVKLYKITSSALYIGNLFRTFIWACIAVFKWTECFAEVDGGFCRKAT